MLVSYSFKNYKAFTEGKIELRPITILLGPNSSGKTSLAQILLLMQQTVDAGNQKYKASLKLHGKYVSMGNLENLFKDKDTNKLISFSFEFNSKDLFNLINHVLWRDYTGNLYMMYRNLLRKYMNIHEDKRFSKLLKKDIKPSHFKNRLDYNFNDPIIIQKLINYIDELQKSMKGVDKAKGIDKAPEYYFEEIRYRLTIRGRRILTVISINDLTCVNELLRNIKNIKTNIFKLEYVFFFDPTKAQLYICKITLKNKDSRILEIVFDKEENKIIEIDSDFVDKSFLNNYNATIQKYIDNERSLFYLFNDDYQNISRYHFAELIRKILFAANEELRNNFNDDRLYHISPLRAEPKRFYFLDRANIDTMSGDNMVEVLKENDKLLEKVNTWLKIFKVKISVTEFKELIHRLTVTQDGLDFDLDITDVGFGISQILPVIVQGFISINNSLTIIEQPEIHLHPKMQAELADLFIDIIKEERKHNDHNKILLIETHSEYLLKRLRRRISEGKIKAEDVAIYFIHPRTENEDTKLEKIKIHKNGSFKWPKDFYIDDLEDTIQFLKNQ